MSRNRGALGVMMDEVREGTVDIVLTWKIDRLARSLNHLAQLLAEFQTNKVALVCPSQGIDTTSSNPCAEFQINILAAVAQFERELIVERVKAGIVAAKLRGIRLGRPRKNDRHFDHVRELIADGRNAAEIGRSLKIPYSSATEIVRKVKATQLCNFKRTATGSNPVVGSIRNQRLQRVLAVRHWMSKSAQGCSTVCTGHV